MFERPATAKSHRIVQYRRVARHGRWRWALCLNRGTMMPEPVASSYHRNFDGARLRATQMPQIGNNCGSGLRLGQSAHIRQGYPADVHRKSSFTIVIRKISFAPRAARDTIHALARNTASDNFFAGRS